jgi:hypothetical protein
MLLKRVKNWPFMTGGIQHSGWLPPGAAVPRQTPIVQLRLDVAIEPTDGGYLLVWSAQPSGEAPASEPRMSGDTWHQTIAEAEGAAEEMFGIKSEHWMDCAGSA